MSAEPYINETTRKLCESYEQRNFGVRFSGHGSSFIPQHPICNKTFEDAKQEAIEWELKADTIGGRSDALRKITFGYNVTCKCCNHTKFVKEENFASLPKFYSQEEVDKLVEIAYNKGLNKQ